MKLAHSYGDKPVAELPMLFQRILSNTTFDWFRRRKTRNALFSNMSDFESAGGDGDFDILETLEAQNESEGTESAQDATERAQILREIDVAVKQLPGRQREAFLMRYWEEMDVAETAAAMGCCQRAQARLRREGQARVSPGYVLKRIALIGYTLFVVSLIVFAITQILPADAAVTLLGEYATAEALAAVREKLGLDAPVWLQYGRWLIGVLHGDFGISMRTGQPVGPVLFEALGRSLLLALFAILLMLCLALPLGIVAAVRRGKITDLAVSVTSYVGVSVPEFVSATLLILVFADWLQWLPATGYVPLTEDLPRGLKHLVLPVLTVSIIMIAHVSRMVRSELVDVLHTDYIRAARLKGLSARAVLFKHALRNALLPTITIVALDVGYLLGGVIVVEEIFALPGIGRQLIVAIQSRDLPSIQAGALIMASTYAVANFLADMAYAWLDRRIQYD